MAMPLADMGRAVDLRRAALWREHRLIRAEPHGPAEITARFAALQRVAARPFRHQPDHRMIAPAELAGARAIEVREMPRRLDHRHLQAETDPEIGQTALAGKPRRFDHALRPALAEAARNENAVNPIELS